MLKLFNKGTKTPHNEEDFVLKAADTTKDFFPYHKERTSIELFGDKSVWTTTYWASRDKQRWYTIGYKVKTVHEWSSPPRNEGISTPRSGGSIKG